MLGILTGHFYYYLKYVYPRDQGGEIITTPNILYRWLPNYTPMRSTGFNSFPTASSVRSQRTATNDPSSFSGHNWGGRGRVLGSG